MKFIADMGISQTNVEWLKEQGFDAIHVRDSKMHRASDHCLYNRLLETNYR